MFPKHPYILNIDLLNLTKIGCELGKLGFNHHDLKTIFDANPEVMLYSAGSARDMLNYLKNHSGVTPEKIRQIYTTNPRLFSIEFSSGFIPRMKVFKKFNVNKELFLQILEHYPRIILKS